MKNPDYKILTPGPVPLSAKTRDILSQQIWHHRVPEFETVLSYCLNSLKTFFDCDGHVFILTSTGSGGMEAALVNTLSPGDKVLCAVAGKFGQRWADMAEAFGIHITRYEVPWGKAVDPVAFKAAYEKQHYNAVLLQACETSTGVLHPFEQIGTLLKPETLFLVDGITATGALPMSMQKQRIDVLVGGSQKAFSLPTGLSFVGFSDRALAAMKKAQCPKFYFDLPTEFKANQKNQTRFSSSTTLIRALESNLKTIFEMGLEAHFQRIQELSNLTRQAFLKLNIEIFPETPSPSLTAIWLDEKVDGHQLRSDLETKFKITVMGGQEHLKGRILRIGHMGDISRKDMRDFFDAFIKEYSRHQEIDEPTRKQVLELFH